MQIEFDPAKDAANRAKHGLALASGKQILENVVEQVADTRFAYGEQRFTAFGYIGSVLHVCVFTWRGDVARIISVRKAGRRERMRYGR